VTVCGLGGQGSVPSKDKDFSLSHHILTCFVAHPASYPMGTGNSLSRVK